MKKEFIKIMNKHYWSEISEDEAYDALFNLFRVSRCVCKIPEPRIKCSENGIQNYCGKCAKKIWQI